VKICCKQSGGNVSVDRFRKYVIAVRRKVGSSFDEGMFGEVCRHEFKVFDDVAWAVITEIAAAGGCHDIWGSVENAGVSNIHE
jgi:hypothetical protein